MRGFARLARKKRKNQEVAIARTNEIEDHSSVTCGCILVCRPIDVETIGGPFRRTPLRLHLYLLFVVEKDKKVKEKRFKN